MADSGSGGQRNSNFDFNQFLNSMKMGRQDAPGAPPPPAPPPPPPGSTGKIPHPHVPTGHLASSSQEPTLELTPPSPPQGRTIPPPVPGHKEIPLGPNLNSMPVMHAPPDVGFAPPSDAQKPPPPAWTQSPKAPPPPLIGGGAPPRTPGAPLPPPQPSWAPPPPAPAEGPAPWASAWGEEPAAGQAPDWGAPAPHGSWQAEAPAPPPAWGAEPAAPPPPWPQADATAAHWGPVGHEPPPPAWGQPEPAPAWSEPSWPPQGETETSWSEPSPAWSEAPAWSGDAPPQPAAAWHDTSGLPDWNGNMPGTQEWSAAPPEPQAPAWQPPTPAGNGKDAHGWAAEAPQWHETSPQWGPEAVEAPPWGPAAHAPAPPSPAPAAPPAAEPQWPSLPQAPAAPVPAPAPAPPAQSGLRAPVTVPEAEELDGPGRSLQQPSAATAPALPRGLSKRRPGPEVLGLMVRPSLSLRLLLEHLVEVSGSDLHLSAGVPACIRLKGDIQSTGVDPMTPEEMEQMLLPILSEEQAEVFRQTSDLDFALEVPGLARFRVNFARQYRGMSCVMRIIPKDIPRLADLNLPAVIERIANTRRGLVIVTGPTGSGKSTTLAAMLNEINLNRQAHIITIEDPIEFVHESKKSLITHREVGTHATSFADAIRAAVREDPDIVLVGEMRDLDTVSQAVRAAEMGMLVLATLHTNNASKAVDRIIDIFPAEDQEQIRITLSEGLKAVVAQQLLKRADNKGRIAVHEILVGSPALSNLIREQKTHQIPSVIQTGRDVGMQLMDQGLIELIQKGLITPEQAREKATDLRNFQRAGIHLE